MLVVAFALAEGQLSGTVTGFVAGLAEDLGSDHPLGRLALAYAVVGYVAGRLHDDTERSTLLPFAAVGLGAVGAVLLYAGVGVLVGDERVTRSRSGQVVGVLGPVLCGPDAVRGACRRRARPTGRPGRRASVSQGDAEGPG